MDAMKLYDVNGRTAWYWPHEAPEGAVEVKPEPKAKAKSTSNKAKTAANKAAEPASK